MALVSDIHSLANSDISLNSSSMAFLIFTFLLGAGHDSFRDIIGSGLSVVQKAVWY